MNWEEFYDRVFDWKDSTVRSRIYDLTDIGTGDEVAEVIWHLENDKTKALLLRRAMQLGVTFSRDETEELEFDLPEETYRELLAYTGYGEEEEDTDLLPKEEAEEEFEAATAMPIPSAKPRGIGFWRGLAIVLKALFGASPAKDNGRCNGDCAHCPPHYGYRYGRWYYGHGHRYGCQRGGNGRGRNCPVN